MKILFITNIPSPYRVDFFNQLGRHVELTVVFRARRSLARVGAFNWRDDGDMQFQALYLNCGFLEERKCDLSILGHIRKNEYDFIFATQYGNATELLAILKMIFFRIPFVLEIDGGIIRDGDFFRQSVKKFVIPKAIYCFSPSKGSDEFLCHYGADSEKIVRYPFTSISSRDVLAAMPTRERKSKLKAELDLPDKPTILFVGQIIKRKGIDVLLKALLGIQEDFMCVIIGARADSEYYDNLLPLLSDRVRMLDFLTEHELVKYYECADFMTFPTRHDEWGLVVNEAMAKGLPVITTTKCTAGMELVTDGVTGHLFEVDDVCGLNDMIRLYLQNPEETRKKGSNSLELIRNHTIEKMVDCHMLFFKAKRGHAS